MPWIRGLWLAAEQSVSDPGRECGFRTESITAYYVVGNIVLIPISE